MRARLLTLFLAPIIIVLLVLGGAFAGTSARNIEQAFMNQQLDDLRYFLVGARQALVSGNTSTLEGEIARYSELYGGRVTVLDRTGATLVGSESGMVAGSQEFSATTAAEEKLAERIDLALSGGRSGLTPPGLPWNTAPVTIVEPITAAGGVLGAVVLSSSVAVPTAAITTQTLLLIAVFSVVIAVLVFVILRLVRWVLRPILRVDHAMAEIEHGEIGARIDDDTGPPEMQRMIRIFNSMAGEIESVIVRQQEFAMNASHELRNPLSALLMRVEYLATGLDKSWDDDVEKAREDGARMTRILDTLLLMARSERQNSPFVSIELGEIVQDRVAAWQQVACDRGVRFGVHLDPAARAHTDRTALESALDAVIDNALKFAPRGSTIDVAARRETGGYALVVRDRGPGLSEEEIGHVTERFWRSARDQNVTGSGLGLAIANDLLRSLGGKIVVSHGDGSGLQVALIVPEGTQ